MRFASVVSHRNSWMMVPLGPVMALLVALAVKHFLADFLLQTSTVARGKAASRGWLGPLLLHAFGHAAITLAIALAFYPRGWWVAVVEFVVHAAIDRGKVLIANRSMLNPGMARFWWLFGFDQLMHQLTNVAIAGVLLMSIGSG